MIAFSNEDVKIKFDNYPDNIREKLFILRAMIFDVAQENITETLKWNERRSNIMIKKTFIKKQIDKTKREKKTSLFLRRLIFFVVDIALKKYYKNTFSMKCLQSSVAIGILLDIYGIKSKEYMGSVCVSQVFKDKHKSPSWTGFWDKDHHIFLTTENNEIVDLTIHYLHLHPMSKGNSQLQVPAVWWSDIDRWPKILKYLPAGQVEIQLPEEETLDLDKFKKFVLQEHSRILKNYTVNEILFHPILHGIESLEELYNKGNDWLKESYIFEEHDIPLPPWIQNKEDELMHNYLMNKET